MAELAGSIIGIISAGTKVALVLSQLAADMGSAGQEARMISSEIRTFCTILSTLKDTMEKIQTSSYYTHCFDVVQGMTTASIDMFTEVLNAAETLKTMAADKIGRDGKFTFVNKIQWVVFQKPKIVVLRAAIEAYKSNIAMMLGAINIVEKVARRTPTTPALSTVTEDNQEQATLESLKLDCCSSMISLEQAERQYKEYLLGQDPPLHLEHTLHDLSIELGLPIHPGSQSDSDDSQVRLLCMARRDVNSIRSSFKSIFDGQESLQAQVSRHSQNLSTLVAQDHKRLSQRWSRPLDDSFSMCDIPHADEPNSSLQQESATHDQPAILKHPEQQGIYIDFRDWLLNQPWSQQDQVLDALRSAMYCDRIVTDQPKVASINPQTISNVPSSTDRVTSNDLGRLWARRAIEATTSIEEATTSLESTSKTRVEPRSDDAYKRPDLQIRPRLRIHKAGNSSVSFPAKQPVGYDHRRARSHDVTGSGSQSFMTQSAGNLDQAHDVWGLTSPDFLNPRATSQERQFSFQYMPHFR